MKVICIDNSPGEQNIAHELLKCGDIYSASQSTVHMDSYVLQEVPINPKDGVKISFKKSRFVPLSDIDESVRLEACLEEQKSMDKVLMALAETSDEPMPQDAFERTWNAIQQRL